MVELDRARTTFIESSCALSAFVRFATNSITAHGETSTQLKAKFARAMADEQPESLTGGVGVEFTTEETALMLDVVEEYMEVVQRFPAMLMEMALVNLLASFDAFVADAFRAVLVSRPEMLRSNRQLSYETILSYEDRDGLIGAMAAREVNDIAYKSLSDQIRYYAEHFGVDLATADGVVIADLIEVAARRNLLVHNAGIVNNLYAVAVPGSSAALGDRLGVEADYWTNAIELLTAAVSAIDRGLRDKFAPAPPESSPSTCDQAVVPKQLTNPTSDAATSDPSDQERAHAT
jgi:hypothetical protein